jgi:hypothetical protein
LGFTSPHPEKGGLFIVLALAIKQNFGVRDKVSEEEECNGEVENEQGKVTGLGEIVRHLF